MKRKRMPKYRQDAIRECIKRWIKENERGPTWLAKKAGYTRTYISLMLSGKMDMTEAAAEKIFLTIDKFVI